MYLVTVTPVTLKVAIENNPKKQKNSRRPLFATAEKYAYGLSTKGIPAELKTQASAPKLQGTKVIIRTRISWVANPNIP